VKVNTGGYGGRTLRKTITVRTSDQKKSGQKLYISGIVEKFATIDPKVALLKGPVGKSIQTSIKIIPMDKYPFTIIGVRAKLGINIEYDLRRNVDGAGYILNITNRKKTKGRYADTIRLITDSNIKGDIKVYVYGHITQERPAEKKTIQKNRLSSRKGM
jgi:hypothetical protein